MRIPKFTVFSFKFSLPDHIDSEKVINAFESARDVDGFHISNVGLLGTGQNSVVPCTPLEDLMMLQDHLGDLPGPNAVVISRSNIVDEPMAQLFIREKRTVRIPHSRTQEIQEVCRQANIVVVAVGRAEMVSPDWIKPSAVVIDVGIIRIVPADGFTKDRLDGNVAFEDATGAPSAR